MCDPERNPYAAPVVTSTTAPPETGRGVICFDDYEADVIQRMSKGMRVTGALEIVVAALLALLVAGTWLALAKAPLLAGLRAGMVLGLPALVMVAVAVVIGLGAIWLIQSSGAFVASIREGRTDGLAQGFQKLRLYLIVTGVFMILSVLLSLLGILAVSAAGRLS